MVPLTNSVGQMVGGQTVLKQFHALTLMSALYQRMVAAVTSVLILQGATNVNVQTRNSSYHQITGHVTLQGLMFSAAARI